MLFTFSIIEIRYESYQIDHTVWIIPVQLKTISCESKFCFEIRMLTTMKIKGRLNPFCCCTSFASFVSLFLAVLFALTITDFTSRRTRWSRRTIPATLTGSLSLALTTARTRIVTACSPETTISSRLSNWWVRCTTITLKNIWKIDFYQGFTDRLMEIQWVF